MRALFTPIAVALASVYCSTLMPVAGWEQTYGLGGHFGDMIMGAMLNLLPVKAQIGIRLAGLVTAVGVLAITAFSLGFERSELQALWRRFVAGLLTASVSSSSSPSPSPEQTIRKRPVLIWPCARWGRARRHPPGSGDGCRRGARQRPHPTCPRCAPRPWPGASLPSPTFWNWRKTCPNPS